MKYLKSQEMIEGLALLGAGWVAGRTLALAQAGRCQYRYFGKKSCLECGCTTSFLVFSRDDIYDPYYDAQRPVLYSKLHNTCTACGADMGWPYIEDVVKQWRRKRCLIPMTPPPTPRR